MQLRPMWGMYLYPHSKPIRWRPRKGSSCAQVQVFSFPTCQQQCRSTVEILQFLRCVAWAYRFIYTVEHAIRQKQKAERTVQSVLSRLSSRKVQAPWFEAGCQQWQRCGLLEEEQVYGGGLHVLKIGCQRVSDRHPEAN